MKTKWKVVTGILVLAAVAGGTIASIKFRQQGQVTVQTTAATRGALTSLVSASGEIKPRNYTNLAANAQGRIAALMVNEGDYVHKGQVVAKVESVQAQADLEAQQANLASAEADAASAEVGVKVQDDAMAMQQATIDRTRAQMEQSKLTFQRTADLWEAKVIAKQEYDQRRAEYEQQQAGMREAQLRLTQMGSQRSQTLASINASQRRVAQARAQMNRVADVLAKYDVIAPLDGVVTNLPVRLGETVVPGVQNSAASAVMTIADMSVITAEVKVDETDIVTLKLGQAATITIDAVPDQTFPGHVIEIGNTAILRSTGAVAANNTSSNEAKDFKVVIALDDPPSKVRPGLSCTAKIVTAMQQDVIVIPLQALTVRQKGDLAEAATKAALKGKEQAPVKDGNKPIDIAAQRESREEVIGLFVIKDGVAQFRHVETGITGSTEIEVTSGLEAGELIMVGPYQMIRNLRPGSKVIIDNRTGVEIEQKG
ncbi:MAG: efflux RND transporter periplasmic adaptor subunit [Acidobacteriota bacterium]